MLEFEVDLRRSNGAVLVAVRGELDLATAPQLSDALAGASDGERLIVDLQSTTFVDSTGLTTLFRAHKRAGGDFAIVCTDDNLEVMRVVRLMGFHEVFAIHDSRAAAGWDGGEPT